MTTQATDGSGSNQKDTKVAITNYGEWIDVTKGPLIESHLYGFITWRINRYGEFNYRDYDLWAAFVEDFIDFTETHFQLANKDCVRNLRDFLCANGVYVHRQARVSMAKELFKVLQEDNPHEWTDDEIQNQIKSSQGFNSILKSRLPAASMTPTITTTTPILSTVVTTTIPPAAVITTIPAPSTSVITTPALSINTTTSIITTTAGHGHELGNLAKVYEDEVKYDGEMDTSNHDKADIVNSEGEGRGNEDTPLDKLDLHDDLETLILETDSPHHDDPDPNSDQSITTLGTIDGCDMLFEKLANQSTYHILAKDINTHDNDDSFAYTTHEVENKYTQKELDNIIIDTVSN